jgi:hypothetical protein
MSWNNFLQLLYIEYELTASEKEILLCFQEEENSTQDLTKDSLWRAFKNEYYEIEYETFTKRLTGIYEKFQITGNGPKFQKLYRIIRDKYDNYQNETSLDLKAGLTNIHPEFPRKVFREKIDNVINLDDPDMKKVDIFQTFAPNLDYFFEQLIRCLRNNVQVRILLAWTHSRAAQVRQEALRRRRSTNANVDDEINISDCVEANLETLVKIFSRLDVDDPELLKIKLYDTSPSVAIYRAGDYMLVSNFFHGKLAIDTPQMEFNLDPSDQVLVSSYLQEFEYIWQEHALSRAFRPSHDRNWRNDLKTLFLED